MLKWRAIWAIWTALGIGPAYANVALLLEEPFGGFWSMNPAHSAIYLSRMCVDSPLSLRRCTPGEQGTVISRYHKIDGWDWIAIPVIPYLYAVERPDQLPRAATRQQIAQFRDAYRRSHLEEVAPDRSDGSPPSGNWTELVGEAYDRAIYGFEIETTVEQDERLMRELQSRPNRARYNLLFRNCADFVREVFNFYFPKALHRGFIPDVGIMTPRQAAKCLIRFARQHRQLRLSIFAIPQVPGPKPRSKTMQGILSMTKPEEYSIAPFQIGARNSPD